MGFEPMRENPNGLAGHHLKTTRSRRLGWTGSERRLWVAMKKCSKERHQSESADPEYEHFILTSLNFCTNCAVSPLPHQTESRSRFELSLCVRVLGLAYIIIITLAILSWCTGAVDRILRIANGLCYDNRCLRSGFIASDNRCNGGNTCIGVK